MTDSGNADSSPGFDGALKHGRNRARVLIEIANDEDEIALSSGAFRKSGWLARTPRKGEVASDPGRNRTWLIVQVRFPGYQRPTADVAVKLVDQVIYKFNLDASVRHAKVISPPREPVHDYRIQETYRDRPKHPALTSLLRLFDKRQTTEVLRLPASIRGLNVRAELARMNTGCPFDPSRQSIRAATAGSLADGLSVATNPHSFSLRFGAVICLLGAVSCGLAAGFSTTTWKVVLLAMGVALCVPLAWAVPKSIPLPRRIFIALVVAVGLPTGSMRVAIGTAEHSPRILLVGCGVLLAAVITGYGLRLTIRDSPLVAHLSWAIPFAASIFVPLSLWIGGNFDAEYLGGRFGIPASTVSVSTFERLSIAARPVGVGLGFVLFFIGLIGWARYFHTFDEGSRWPSLLMVATCSVFFLATAIFLGLGKVSAAASAAAVQAHSGLQPSGYFGLQATFVCVRSVTTSIPVYDGPLPTTRALLTFGTDTDWIWLWDPKTARAIGVPLDDVTVTPAIDVPAHC